MQSKDEIKVYCDTVMGGLEEYFGVIDEIAKQFFTDADTMAFPQYKPIEHKLVGMFTFINAKYKEVSAKADSVEAGYFNQLRCKAEIDRVKFVAESGKREAEEYAADIKLAAAVLEAWVGNIEQLLTTCRRGLYVDKKEKTHG